jgi:hypothetical protein
VDSNRLALAGFQWAGAILSNRTSRISDDRSHLGWAPARSKVIGGEEIIVQITGIATAAITPTQPITAIQIQRRPTDI